MFPGAVMSACAGTGALGTLGVRLAGVTAAGDVAGVFGVLGGVAWPASAGTGPPAALGVGMGGATASTLLGKDSDPVGGALAAGATIVLAGGS